MPCNEIESPYTDLVLVLESAGCLLPHSVLVRVCKKHTVTNALTPQVPETQSQRPGLRLHFFADMFAQIDL